MIDCWAGSQLLGPMTTARTPNDITGMKLAALMFGPHFCTVKGNKDAPSIFIYVSWNDILCREAILGALQSNWAYLSGHCTSSLNCRYYTE